MPGALCRIPLGLKKAYVKLVAYCRFPSSRRDVAQTMGIKKFSPTTPSRRYMTVVSARVSRRKSRRNRCWPAPEIGGRNNTGRVTSRFISGGHKQAYRIIDFKRDKSNIPAKVVSTNMIRIVFGAHCSAELCGWREALHYRSRYLAGRGATVSCPKPTFWSAMPLPLKNIPAGTIVHNIELRPGKGGRRWRAFGRYAGAAGFTRRWRSTAEAAVPA